MDSVYFPSYQPFLTQIGGVRQVASLQGVSRDVPDAELLEVTDLAAAKAKDMMAEKAS